jgi:hypothetical protein
MYMFKARERARQEYQAALDQYGITEQQAHQFLRGSRYAKTFYKAPHVVAGTGADLIHEIGPLIGKGRLARAKVHAARTVTRVKDTFTKDLPHAKHTFEQMAPYLPSLGRLVYVELKEKLPAPKNVWQALMRRAVPRAEQSVEARPASSQRHVSPPIPRSGQEPSAVRLQVVS